MSDTMRIQPFATQLRRILAEYERKRSVFDIHESLFYTPSPSAPFAIPSLFGRRLDTPIGPSAGPHTQLGQNIVSAWLCGGRFIELKTVQVKDDLVIPRPCIDMTDEGYNVEWSQELGLGDSAHEYVNAWALLHLLPRVLGWEARRDGGPGPGAIFDMSVGYTLSGLRDDRMTRFMDVMADASEPLAAIHDLLSRDFPRFADIDIPARIVNSVTVSTMHGCPPAEIEHIARYLLEERRLHTVVKLNPTLLGKDRVDDILHERLGFTEIEVPRDVFDHDLKYDEAVRLIASLRETAAGCGRTFGVKLSNTLAVRNHAGRLPGDEMYLSGRALYPLTMALYDTVSRQFGGDLHVSYSAGADATNVATILSCGAVPVTGCTDLLKPGGFGRLAQWLENLGAAMEEGGAANLDEWAQRRADNLAKAASAALADPRYAKRAFKHGSPKVASPLPRWDCVAAPCVEACAVHQDVPDYAHLVAKQDYDGALRAILSRNPLPGVTGHVCTHLCETRCTRNDYDEAVAIRALKRVAEERGQAGYSSVVPGETRPRGIGPETEPTRAVCTRKVAIVGSGPSGLAAAVFLAVNGVHATIFEARDVPGGMMRLVPPFRLPQAVIDRDIDRIRALGVEIRLGTLVTDSPETLRGEGFDAVYVASGFQRDAPLRLPGIDGPGVLPALRLLDRSRRGQRVELGRRAVIVGGGDTAMDAARTARRLTGQPAVVLYRRTRHEMPASEEELEGTLEEGNVLEELVSPVEVLREDRRVVGIRCVRNVLGEPASDGRRRPVAIPGSEFDIACDSVVVAVGQLPELSFLHRSAVTRHSGGGIVVNTATGSAGPDGVYAGGDVVVEPGSIISAVADGRRAAEAICRQLRVPFLQPGAERPVLSAEDVQALKQVRARRLPQQRARQLPLEQRRGFDLIDVTLGPEAARQEALRCVQCSTFCDKCVEVCPNRANYSFEVDPVTWELPLLARSGARSEIPGGIVGVLVAGAEEFRLAQNRQIVHVDDFCNECDNCRTFCVHHGRPYADKPRLFLDAAAFGAERDNAFYIEDGLMRRRDEGRESRLTMRDGGAFTYEDDELRVTFTCEWTLVEAEAKKAFEGKRSLRRAAELLVLHRGIGRSLPFLLVR